MTNDTKSTEPSDEAHAELEERQRAAQLHLCHPYSAVVSTHLVGFRAGRASRDAEVAALRSELQSEGRIRSRQWNEHEKVIASLRDNSMAAAVEALRAEANVLWGKGCQALASDYERMADWLSRQASQGAQQHGMQVVTEPGGSPVEFLSSAPIMDPPPVTRTSTAADVVAALQPYETAPRLTKGVRYRVVESRGPYWAVGEEFVYAGTHCGFDGGWFSFPHIDGSHRVVRVEPEKCERCGGERMVSVCGLGYKFCPACNGTGEKARGDG